MKRASENYRLLCASGLICKRDHDPALCLLPTEGASMGVWAARDKVSVVRLLSFHKQGQNSCIWSAGGIGLLPRLVTDRWLPVKEVVQSGRPWERLLQGQGKKEAGREMPRRQLRWLIGESRTPSQASELLVFGWSLTPSEAQALCLKQRGRQQCLTTAL